MFPAKHLLLLAAVIIVAAFSAGLMIELDIFSKASVPWAGIVTALGAVPALVGGYGYNRLSVFDNLDGIDSQLRKKVRNKIKQIKRQFLQIILFSVFGMVILALCMWLTPFVEALKYFIAIFFSFYLWIEVLVLVFISPILEAIEALREKVEDEKTKEKKRQALIAKLQEEREKHPLLADNQLDGYTRLHSN